MRILIKWIVKSGRPMTTQMYAKNVWKEFRTCLDTRFIRFVIYL